MESVVNGLSPVQADPSSGLVILDVKDTEGVRLGEEVHVCQVFASDGELHRGDGGEALAR